MTEHAKRLEQQVFDQRQKYKSIFSRYSSKCHYCQLHVGNGVRIVSMDCGWVHSKCADEIIAGEIEAMLGDEGAVLSGRADQQRMDAEYAQGYAEAKQYSNDVKSFGREQAEQWEMEAEQGRYNRGED